MEQITRPLILAFGLVLAATTAQAACQVEYKAKRDKPLELYYDVTVVNAPCASAEASCERSARVSSEASDWPRVGASLKPWPLNR